MTERRYRDFAEHEAVGRSPLYVELAAGVADDRELLNWLDGLPPAKRQPNLVALARDGHRVAWADGHGALLSWGNPRG